MASDASAVFFELSWSILSTICMANVLFGFLVCSITSFTPLAAVPMISSAAGAIADGLCFYSNYGTRPDMNRAVSSVFADIFWVIQETGLLFYSYIILKRVLRGARWRIFASIFWAGITGIVVTRIVISVYRVRSILGHDESLQHIINYLHIAYFGLMAVLECTGAYFLIIVFTSARASSVQISLNVGFFRYLSRSTEGRVAILAIQGVFRAITHSLKTPGQSAENLASQLDRFAYALFCLFPVVLYIDLLASKLIFTDQKYPSSQSRPGLGSQPRQFTSTQKDEFAGGRGEHVVEFHGGVSKTHRSPVTSESTGRRRRADPRMSSWLSWRSICFVEVECGSSGNSPMRANSDICWAAIRIPHTDVMSDAYQKPEAIQYASSTLDQENDAVTIAVTVIPYGK
ncbi:hypothetical protein G7Z17_g1742 [Cylindrodendrum hubeiense]|uniref:Uncharacterized protein n=1 Tax=Cylindrodendrum hubeiense TaxID=595255 RepID=A0A9P5HKB4_9HYPO|nr:hypothetical protein G7Z17_g1742 [Cylindrodendrum hubeiense]